MATTSLDAADLRGVMASFRDALRSHREALNSLNVYPVPDGDTGSNMTATLESVMAELDGVDLDSGIDAVAGAIAHGSLMGARGNSGVILSQILRGLTSVLDSAGVDGRIVADGMAAASTAAYAAVGAPVEGTILTVVREASAAAVKAADAGASLLAVAEAAREVGGQSLERTPELLPVLAEAGVVDAGGYGFVLFLDALLTVVDGRPLPEPPGVLEEVVTRRPDNHQQGVSDSTRYEVMYLLDAPEERVPDFRTAWDSIGDSVVVVGGDGLWNCHVHTNDIGAAIEAGIAAGRPHQIRVTDLFEEVAEQAWVREQLGGLAEDPGDPIRCAVVAVANGDGVGNIFRSLGVRLVVAGGQSMNPSTADLLEAVESVQADEVIVLPNNPNIIAVAKQVDAQTNKMVQVVGTSNVAEGFAALLSYDPDAPLDDNLVAMLGSAEAVTSGEVTVAVRDASSDAGVITEGDHLGLSGGRVHVIAASLADATTGLLDQLLAGEHELVTLIAGADADQEVTNEVVGWLRTEHPSVEVEVHHGGQPLYPYYVGIE
ncbi:MAG: DAK2 domain-containing protein [Actinomycetota bacterium]|nr:DAK2 domain-containing protein [Actinomycetota bacterium]